MSVSRDLDLHELALRLGGTWKAPEPHGLNTRETLAGPADEPGLRVLLDRRGRGGVIDDIHVLVEAPGAADLELRLTRGFVYALARSLGVQDLPLVDPVADEAFVFKSSDEARASLWIDEPACRAILDDPKARWAIRAGLAEATRPGAATVDEIAALVDATRVLATRAVRLREAWRPVATELGGRLEIARRAGFLGDLLARIPALGDEAVITVEHRAPDPAADAPALYTRVGARRPGGGKPFAVGRPRVRGLPDWGPGADPARTAAALDEAQAAAILGEPDEVSVWLAGHVLDAARWEAAATVAVRLAGGERPAPAGAYR